MPAKDRVCGMTIGERDAVETIGYGGTTYYFCGKDCVEEFRKDSEA